MLILLLQAPVSEETTTTEIDQFEEIQNVPEYYSRGVEPDGTFSMPEFL